MGTKFRTAVVVILTLASLAYAERVGAAEPHWSPVIVARGHYRQHLEHTPITMRPYRPFHFYGNTVRRLHYRGTPLPSPEDLSRTITFAVRRP
ncbi:hypothetical protein [Roseimaritima sediminicola]|uniref:hypothetical protein n=1 Tax=Roseimaritima sediminicola TaxID=2662066 RepID=UPI00129846C4|nr:hypothetical protein [Roseimaritima sediminicola]